MLQLGTVLDGRYQIDYVVKQGGMGTVYAATDLRLERPCAVKAVTAMSPEEAAQIRHEARVLAGLCYPHLPTIYDCMETSTAVFVVMQMIHGDDLEAVTLRGGPPGWETLVGWGIQLAETVKFLHEQAPPVIHRDIKPANIRLAPHGHIYLVDFGIAKTLDGAPTVTAARAASVPYAPIEQIQDGSHTDQQSDIYSFGATLYRLLTSKLPPSCIDRLVGHTLNPVTAINRSVPEPLEALVHQCMELWSADRPGSMTEVVERLRSVHRATQMGGELRTVPISASVVQQWSAPPQQPVGGNGGGHSHSTRDAQHEPQRPATPPPPRLPVAAPLRQPSAPSGPVTRVHPGAGASRRPVASAEIHAAIEAGHQALRGDNAAAAREHFGRAIALAPEFGEAYAGRAQADARLNLYDAALEDWDVAIANGPPCAGWYVERAKVHVLREDIDGALADLSSAIKLDSENAEAYWERAKLHRAAGDGRRYLLDLDRVLQYTPNHRAARLARAEARMDQQLWQAALPDCHFLIESAPREPLGYILRSRVYSELGDTTRAVRDLGEAIAANPASAQTYFLRARLHQRSGDRQAALRDLNHALMLDPEHVDALRRRGQLYRTLGAYREALAEFRALARLLRSRADRRQVSPAPAPARPPIALDLQYLMQTSGMEKARRYLHSQIALFREDHDEDLEERAALFERVGQMESALDDMERVVKLLLPRRKQETVPSG